MEIREIQVRTGNYITCDGNICEDFWSSDSRSLVPNNILRAHQYYYESWVSYVFGPQQTNRSRSLPTSCTVYSKSRTCHWRIWRYNVILLQILSFEHHFYLPRLGTAWLGVTQGTWRVWPARKTKPLCQLYSSRRKECIMKEAVRKEERRNCRPPPTKDKLEKRRKEVKLIVLKMEAWFYRVWNLFPL